MSNGQRETKLFLIKKRKISRQQNQAVILNNKNIGKLIISPKDLAKEDISSEKQYGKQKRQQE